MSVATDKLARVTARLITLIGVVFFITYLAYLPFPALFDFGMAEQTGILFYCLATAGSAFVAWGLILAGIGDNGVSREQILKATAVGLGLLALMRLGTAIFPHAPFDKLQLLPVVEFVVFSFVAVKLYKS